MLLLGLDLREEVGSRHFAIVGENYKCYDEREEDAVQPPNIAKKVEERAAVCGDGGDLVGERDDYPPLGAIVKIGAQAERGYLIQGCGILFLYQV